MQIQSLVPRWRILLSVVCCCPSSSVASTGSPFHSFRCSVCYGNGSFSVTSFKVQYLPIPTRFTIHIQAVPRKGFRLADCVQRDRQMMYIVSQSEPFLMDSQNNTFMDSQYLFYMLHLSKSNCREGFSNRKQIPTQTPYPSWSSKGTDMPALKRGPHTMALSQRIRFPSQFVTGI